MDLIITTEVFVEEEAKMNQLNKAWEHVVGTTVGRDRIRAVTISFYGIVDDRPDPAAKKVRSTPLIT